MKPNRTQEEKALSNTKQTASQDYERICTRLRRGEIGRDEFFHGIRLLYADSGALMTYNQIDRLSEEILRKDER